MQRRYLILFMSLISGFIILFFADYYLEKMVKSKLTRSISGATDGRYRILIEDLQINYLPLSLEISNFKINTVSVDTSIRNNSVSCSLLLLKNIDLTEILFHNRLVIEKIVSVEPVMNFNGEDTLKFKAGSPKKQVFDSIFVSRVELIRSAVNFSRKLPESYYFSYKNGAVYIDNLGIQLKSNDPKPNFSYGSAVALFYQLKWTNNDYYTNVVGKLLISFATSTVEVDSFHCSPVFSPEEFARRFKYQTDQFDLFIPSIRLRNVDYFKVLNEGKLVAGLCNISNVRFEIFRDKNFIRKSGNITSLQKKLATAGVKSDVALITLKNSSIVYKELEVDQSKAGVVTMNEVNGSIFNFCSGQRSLDTIKLDLNANFMGSKLVSFWRFPLKELSVNFECKGEIGKMKLISLNAITKTNAGLTINSGYMEGLHFNIKADYRSAKGQVRMKYSNLNVSVEDQLRSKTLNKMADFALNKWIIRSNSPDNGLTPGSGDIYYPNNPERFFINYSLKALLVGVKDIVIGGNEKK